LANRRFAPRAVRRPTFWEGGVIFNTNATGATVAATLIPEANLENVPNSTLIRIRGEVLCVVTAIGAAASRAIFSMGIKFATASAVAAASVESPLTDIGSDWIWWQSVAMDSSNTLAAPVPDGLTVAKRVEIDSKAMRKQSGLNKVLVFVTQNTVVTSTQTITALGSARVLFKR